MITVHECPSPTQEKGPDVTEFMFGRPYFFLTYPKKTHSHSGRGLMM